MLGNIIAFALNNLFLVVAGGLVAVWLALRVWSKVEKVSSSTNSWGALIFWAAKLIIIVAVLFQVGRWIYSTVNSAVVTAVNSPSIQTAGQALVSLGSGVDTLMSTDMGMNIGGGVPSDIGGAWQSVNLLEPVVNGASSIMDQATTFTAPDGTVYEVSPPDASAVQTIATQPLNQLFTSAAVNAATNQPTSAETSAYIVQRGDSLAKIAAQLGVNMNALCKANGLSNCSLIRTGQKLILPNAMASELQTNTAAATSAKIRQPRYTGNQTVYYKPSQRANQSYLPKSWNVLEQGEMSVGEPALMATPVSEVFASFPTN